MVWSLQRPKAFTLNLKLRHLHYFTTVVDAGSFSRAASIIHIAQPALSRQILELEDMLGVELLHRTARGVRPTPVGEALYREAANILRQMERLPDVVRSARGDIEGTVGVGMSSTLASFLAGPLMEACRTEFPRIKLRLITADSIVLKSRLDASQLDLAVVFEDLPSPGYVRHPLFRQRLYLVHPGRPADAAASVPLERLAKLPLILPTLPNVTRLLIDRVFAEAKIIPNVAGEADVFSSLLSAVQAGMGLVILPKGDLSDVAGYSALFAVPIEPALFLTAAVIASHDAPLGRAAAMVRRILSRLVCEIMERAPPPGAEWMGGSPEATGPGEQ
jgi:LysR family nitrogen assimilation transcriptional regulator